MSTVVKDLGAVSAYAYAVEKGYTGTEAEFAELMADYAEVGQRAEDAADSALESKTAAQTAATTATNKASEATTAAQTATTKAGEASQSASQAQASATTASTKASEASQSASTASTKATEATTAAGTATTAKTDAIAAKTAAQTAQTAAETAQEAAEDAAESVSASAAQIQTNADDISELKEDLNTTNALLGYGVGGNNYGFSKRNINSSDGEYQASSNRIASKHIPVSKGSVLHFSDTTAQFYIWFYTTDNVYIKKPIGSWLRGDYTFNDNYFIVIAIRKNTSDAVIADNEVSTLASYVSISYHGINYVTDIADTIPRELALSNEDLWARYVVGTGGSHKIGTTNKCWELSTTRISLYPLIDVRTAKQISIKLDSGYKYYVFAFNTAVSTMTLDSGWLTDDSVYDLGGDFANITICLAKTDNSTIDVDACSHIELKVYYYDGRLIDIENELKKEVELLPQYWIDYLESKQTALTSADMALGFNGVSFSFVTDVHINTNNKQSGEILKYLSDHTNVKTAICGGDFVTDYNTKTNTIKEITTWNDETSGLQLVNLHGNHDNNSNNQTDLTQVLTDADFYGLCCRQSESYVNWVPNKLYGYSDNTVQKMRFVYLDTGAPDSAVIDSTQIDWMKDRINELPTGWYVIVFCHQFWTGAVKTTPTLQIDGNGTAILNALESIYDTANAIICGVICGHCHRDYSIISTKGFPIIATTCDAGGTNSSLYDPDTPNRTTGTTGEQVIDLYYINTSLRTINVIRIGDGDTTQDRSFTF